MIGYPITYGDYLSGDEAMERRVKFVDQVLALVVLWSLQAAISNARGFPANKLDPCGPTDAPSPNGGSSTFAPVAGICACTSPQVKTAILLGGIVAICYSAMCSNDKPLVIACSSLATYAATNVAR